MTSSDLVPEGSLPDRFVTVATASNRSNGTKRFSITEAWRVGENPKVILLSTDEPVLITNYATLRDDSAQELDFVTAGVTGDSGPDNDASVIFTASARGKAFDDADIRFESGLLSDLDFGSGLFRPGRPHELVGIATGRAPRKGRLCFGTDDVYTHATPQQFDRGVNGFADRCAQDEQALRLAKGLNDPSLSLRVLSQKATFDHCVVATTGPNEEPWAGLFGTFPNARESRWARVWVSVHQHKPSRIPPKVWVVAIDPDNKSTQVMSLEATEGNPSGTRSYWHSEDWSVQANGERKMLYYFGLDAGDQKSEGVTITVTSD